MLLFQNGITQTVKRHVKASNKYMKNLYNLYEKRIYFQYLDENNLFGWAMVQKLPTHGFLWKEAEDFTPEETDELAKKGEREYRLELEVGYPKELHKNDNELPF